MKSRRAASDPDLLARRLGELEPGLSALAPRLDAYLDLLQRWNRIHNLTAIDSYPEMIDKHLLDSLVCLPHLRRDRVLDVGSGAGVPGLIWAIADTSLALTLVEPTRKRALFLRQAVIELDIANTEILNCRVEQVAGPGRWDTIASRAFGDLDRLYQATRPLHAPGVRLLLLKGRRPDTELAAAHATGLRPELIPLHIPGLDAERHLLVLDLS